MLIGKIRFTTRLTVTSSKSVETQEKGVKNSFAYN